VNKLVICKSDTLTFDVQQYLETGSLLL